jgi:hypothetical protein
MKKGTPKSVPRINIYLIDKRNFYRKSRKEKLLNTPNHYVQLEGCLIHCGEVSI